MKRLILASVLSCLFGSPILASEIVAVTDGDTITVKENNQNIVIRFACIDAPEPNQNGGTASTNRLKQLLPVGSIVDLTIFNKDRYGRTVAIVSKDKLNINLVMVQEGQAVIDPRYINNCSDSDRYIQAQNQAQIMGSGFWRLPNQIMPWDWRANNQNKPMTSVPIKPDSISKPKPVNLPSCAKGGDCDCKDFKTQAEAQRVFNAFPGDPHKLDKDKDGIACENLK